MSDLQCAATVIIAPLGHGEYDDTRALAESLRGRRVAIVYTSGAASTVRSAEVASGVLATQVRVHDELRGAADGEPGDAVAERVTRELEAIADLHRGETVLVITHSDVITQVLPRLARNLGSSHAAGRRLSGGSAVELSADADGWVCTSWAGEAPR